MESDNGTMGTAEPLRGTANGALVLFLSVIQILASLIALPSNVAIVYIIYRTPSLRTKCFILIAAVAFIDILYSIQYMTVAVFELLVSSNLVSVFTTATSCIFIRLMFYSYACNVLICAVACDRLFAFIMPVRYFHTSMRATKVTLVVCACMFLADLIVVLASSASLKVVSCSNVITCLHPHLATYFSAKIIALDGLTAVLYVIFIVIGQIQVRQVKNNPSSNSNQFLKRQLKILPAINVIFLLHVVTLVTPGVFVLGLAPTFGASAWFGTFSKIVTSFPTWNPALNFVFYMWKSRDFKNAVVTWLGLAVPPVQSSGQQPRRSRQNRTAGNANTATPREAAGGAVVPISNIVHVEVTNF